MAKKKNKKQGGSKGQNRAKSSSFLDKNRLKDGVITTASGLQYTIIDDAGGKVRPFISDMVRVEQRAWLVGGKILTDTYKEGMPAEFILDEVIDGYQEGLQMMSVGSKYRFFIPPELAWGEKGSGGRIGPNAVVIFETKLLQIL